MIDFIEFLSKIPNNSQYKTISRRRKGFRQDYINKIRYRERINQKLCNEDSCYGE